MTASVETALRWTCLAIALVATGCLGGGRAERGKGSALWLGPDSAPVDAAQLGRLEGLGVSGLFLEAATLEWAGAEPRLEARRLAAPARRMPVTLVLSGQWPSRELEPKRVAAALGEQLDSLRVGVERGGILPVGIHLDLAAEPAGFRSLAEVANRLRRRFEGRWLVSLAIDRRALGEERARELARGADFLVCFLYGQRPGEPEDPGAWDLQSVEANVGRLERLGRPYLLGAAMTGQATWRASGGAARAVTSELDLRRLVDDRRLELRPGFTLEGVDRQTFEFVTRSGAAVGSWKLGAGDSVRVVKTSTPFLEEFLRRVGAWNSPNRLGELFYRVRGAAERLSLDTASLEAALALEAAAPRLDLRLERPFRSDRLWRVKIQLMNQSAEPTDLAFFDTNYVELRLTEALVGEVVPGQFRRFELLYEGRERGTMRAVRWPDTLRLYAPIVEGKETVTSGEIEIRLHGRSPKLVASAVFLLPEGRLATVEPIEWTFEEP